MFELYFGAFDVVLYALAFIAAVMISGGICDVLESDVTVLSLDSTNSALSYVSCEPSVRPMARRSLDPQPVPATIPPSETAQSKPVLRISDVRLYKLHQRSVVPLSALSFSIPETIKRYMLRGEPVIRLESLQNIATVIG